MSTKPAKNPRRQVANENRAVEAATVAWMLAMMTTLVCLGVAGVMWAIVYESPPGSSGVLFARFMHFSAIVSGVLTLILEAVVLKMRTQAPPLSISIFAGVIGVLPIVALMFI